MRLCILLLMAFCISLLEARAQLSVEIALEQQQFLKDEAMPVKVKITNRSGQTLHFGKDADWLSFSVDSRDGSLVPKLREPQVPGEFDLESATVVTRQVDLMPYFDFSQPGRYNIAATVKVRDWDQEISSKAAVVEVKRGSKIWQQQFGVPKKQGPPESRKYILQQATFLKDQTLYVRVTDEDENRTFRVFPAGRLLSFSRPEAQVDRDSKLHLLFQNGPHSFLYTVVKPDGDILLRQTYDFASGQAVRLRQQEDGFIFVSGGVRRIQPDEVAAPPGTNEVKTSKP